MEHYEELDRIGKGSFGEVWKIRRKSDNKFLVWKKLDYGQMNEKEKAQLVAEVNILRELRHPHIVRYFDRIIDRQQTRIYIIMEYCEFGDLGTLIKRCRREGQWLNEDCIWKIFSQIVQALHECHTRNAKILHRDLKPGNVFLDSNYQVKLGDFGLARVLSENSLFANTTVGTPYYMSPEQIERNSYGAKSDVWSAGCLLYEMAALTPPFEAENQYVLSNKIRRGKFKRLPPRYSDELQRVVSWMLSIDPNLRPGSDDLQAVPQISIRLRERRLRENYAVLRQREESVKNKEKELQEQSDVLRERERNVEETMSDLQNQKSNLIREEKIRNNAAAAAAASSKGSFERKGSAVGEDGHNDDDGDGMLGGWQPAAAGRLQSVTTPKQTRSRQNSASSVITPCAGINSSVTPTKTLNMTPAPMTGFAGRDHDFSPPPLLDECLPIDVSGGDEDGIENNGIGIPPSQNRRGGGKGDSAIKTDQSSTRYRSDRTLLRADSNARIDSVDGDEECLRNVVEGSSSGRRGGQRGFINTSGGIGRSNQHSSVEEGILNSNIGTISSGGCNNNGGIYLTEASAGLITQRRSGRNSGRCTPRDTTPTPSAAGGSNSGGGVEDKENSVETTVKSRQGGSKPSWEGQEDMISKAMRDVHVSRDYNTPAKYNREVLRDLSPPNNNINGLTPTSAAHKIRSYTATQPLAKYDGRGGPTPPAAYSSRQSSQLNTTGGAGSTSKAAALSAAVAASKESAAAAAAKRLRRNRLMSSPAACTTEVASGGGQKDYRFSRI
eukprot:GHVL01008066.1.p1 GENE.GHVL01008066.1~~GHVL01008066.1.p1  ORF type:complete len:780 (+),score=155.61 GHVL01008066.1:94-2433(+)